MPQSNYDLIADEYYDEGHVTSRNFDATTAVAIEKLNISNPRGKVLELGAGKGRVQEYFPKISHNRVVQLDNSQAMFDLHDREECSLKVLADACDIPLASSQFEIVYGFLADPYFGLDSMSEAFRMLNTGGKLFLTLPTYQWAISLRSKLLIDVMTTRFKKIGTVSEFVVLPSLIHEPDKIDEILSFCGFNNIRIQNHMLPDSVDQVSPDIQKPAELLGVSSYKLPIIHTVEATK